MYYIFMRNGSFSINILKIKISVNFVEKKRILHLAIWNFNLGCNDVCKPDSVEHKGWLERPFQPLKKWDGPALRKLWHFLISVVKKCNHPTPWNFIMSPPEQQKRRPSWRKMLKLIIETRASITITWALTKTRESNVRFPGYKI